MTHRADIYRVRGGWDVISKRHYAEVICEGSLVKTFFTRDRDLAERQARSYIAQLERGRVSPMTHSATFRLARKAFREGWQTGRYNGWKRRYCFLVACLWAANRVAEELSVSP